MSNFRGAARSLVDLLFPGRCLLCGRDLAALDAEAGCPVCPGCLAGIRPISGAVCRGCGRPLLSEAGTCTRCRSRAHRFDGARPLFEYEGSVRELIYLYKFEGRRRLAVLFARWLAAALDGTWPGVAVVPVPGRKRTLRRRGWGHVEEMARQLERLHGARVLRCLARLPGSEQKLLGSAARAANVRGRILCRAARGGLPSEVVLVDDVLTTGATADECARVLQQAGVTTVRLLTLAID